MKTFDEVLAVATAAHNLDIGDLLVWGASNGDVYASFNVSDVFGWACADAEYVEAQDVPLLENTYKELDAMPDVNMFAELAALFTARKRGMRTQDCILYSKDSPAELIALYEACGPKRENNLANPPVRK